MAAALRRPDLLAFLGAMPLRRMAAFPGSPLTPELIAKLVAAAND